MSDSISWAAAVRRLGDLKPWEGNPKRMSRKHAERLLANWRELGQWQTLAVGPDGAIFDGHQRYRALMAVYGPDYEVTCLQSTRDLTEAERRRLVIEAHAGTVGEFDWDALSSWDAKELEGFGLDDEFVKQALAGATAVAEMLKAEAGGADADEGRKTLAERFGVPPFSVLDARQGYWQARKRAWISLGIKSEQGRGGGGGTPPHPPTVTRNPDGTLNYGGTAGQAERFNRQRQPAPEAYNSGAPGDLAAEYREKGKAGKRAHRLGPGDKKNEYNASDKFGVLWHGGNAESSQKVRAVTEAGTSIFDPVLCELVYRWFMPNGAGHVLDPFAGGSVRGIVAATLGKDYTGIDLSAGQLDANRAQAGEICKGKVPTWIHGDSAEVTTLAPGQYDLVFSCPPYGDLEVYSDDPRDLSVMEYADFRAAYARIIERCVSMLKPDRFACFVVGDIRDKAGNYRSLPADTTRAFEAAGMTFYNDAILVTQVGSLSIRVGRQFSGYRKLGKTHQNVLVYYKGDPKRIAQFGEVEFGEIDATDTAEDGAEGIE